MIGLGKSTRAVRVRRPLSRGSICPSRSSWHELRVPARDRRSSWHSRSSGSRWPSSSPGMSGIGPGRTCQAARLRRSCCRRTGHPRAQGRRPGWPLPPARGSATTQATGGCSPWAFRPTCSTGSRRPPRRHRDCRRGQASHRATGTCSFLFARGSRPSHWQVPWIPRIRGYRSCASSMTPSRRSATVPLRVSRTDPRQTPTPQSGRWERTARQSRSDCGLSPGQTHRVTPPKDCSCRACSAARA